MCQSAIFLSQIRAATFLWQIYTAATFDEILCALFRAPSAPGRAVHTELCSLSRKLIILFVTDNKYFMADSRQSHSAQIVSKDKKHRDVLIRNYLHDHLFVWCHLLEKERLLHAVDVMNMQVSCNKAINMPGGPLATLSSDSFHIWLPGFALRRSHKDQSAASFNTLLAVINNLSSASLSFHLLCFNDSQDTPENCSLKATESVRVNYSIND